MTGRRLGILAVAAAVAASLAVPAASAGHAAGDSARARAFTFYARPTRAQFINHADDRERGDIQSPFQDDTLPTPPSANSGKKGARAGDKALFSFKVYADAKLKRLVGSAVYTCTFNFAQAAICSADFQLTGGSMFATGPAQLDISNIELPVTTGTGRFAGARGQFTSTPAGSSKKVHVLRFELV